MRLHERFGLFRLIGLSVRIWSKPDGCDQVPIVTFWVLIDGTLVEILRGVLLVATTLTGLRPRILSCHSRGYGGEVDDGEGLERILRGLVLESLLVLGPGGALQE